MGLDRIARFGLTMKSTAKINLERVRDDASRARCQPVSAAPEFSQSMTSSMLLTAAYF